MPNESKSSALSDRIRQNGIPLDQKKIEWKEYKLGEIAEIVGGGTPSTSNEDYWDGDIPWLSPKDLTGYNRVYIEKGARNITKEGLRKSSSKLMPAGPVLFSSRAPIGYVAIAKNEICTNQGFKSLVCNPNKLWNVFAYYWLKANTEYLQSLGTGTTFAEISGAVMKSISISIPPLSEQKRIASILSSLDDKIDLLHRENATLEAMAETLFRHLFIENPSPYWKEVSLGKCIKLVGGGTPKTSEESYWNGGVCWLSGGDIANNHKGFVLKSEKQISIEGLNNSSAKLLPENAMIVSARGTVGKYCLLERAMAFSQSNYGIMPVYKNCYFFTYLLVAHHIDELKSASYGSVFDTITTKTFDGITLNLPKEESYIFEFEDRIEPYFSKIKNNSKQIQSLIQTRDCLLPKLMEYGSAG